MPCRLPTVDDAPQLARVHCRAWQSAYPGIMPEEFLASLDEKSSTQRWRGILGASAEGVRVCERDSAIVGFCSFGNSRDDDAVQTVGELYSLNVDPSSWRMGVGRELTAVAVAALQTRGFASITLWVASENRRARRFYEKLGFAPEGRSRAETIRPDVQVPETRYVLKRLAA
jgi:ribosomal protein S18 acetylase RimI-like enzyme